MYPVRSKSYVFCFCYLQVHDTYYFYKNNVEGELNFIWSSERTGYRHLYHINCQLNNVKVDVSNPESESVNNTVSRELNSCSPSLCPYQTLTTSMYQYRMFQCTVTCNNAKNQRQKVLRLNSMHAQKRIEVNDLKKLNIILRQQV